jgi:hypothetical protein
LYRYLTYSLDVAEIRTQDSSNVIIAISRNENGRDLAWDFMVENSKRTILKLNKRVLTTGPLMPGYLY